MPTPSTAHGTSKISRVIAAPREAVYRACIDPDALAAWRAPDNMTGKMHAFDARPGGGYRMSLTYQDPQGSPGKSSADTDTFEGRFVELVPDRKIVEVVVFESPDPRFAGEMTITTTLDDAGPGTEVSMAFENIPSGIRPEDNEEGSRQSLRKLAALVEALPG